MPNRNNHNNDGHRFLSSYARFLRLVIAVLVSSGAGQQDTTTVTVSATAAAASALHRASDFAQLLSNESVAALEHYEAELQAVLNMVQRQIKLLRPPLTEGSGTDADLVDFGMLDNVSKTSAGTSASSDRFIRCLIEDKQQTHELNDDDFSSPQSTASSEAIQSQTQTTPSPPQDSTNGGSTSDGVSTTKQTSSPKSGKKSNLLIKLTKCVQFTEEQLINELKHKGTYNPYFMAWDVRGVLNFFEEITTDTYDKESPVGNRVMTAEQNLAAIEQLVQELNLKNCNLRTPDVLARLYNLTNPAHNETDRLRTRRRITSTVDSDVVSQRIKYLYNLQNDRMFDEPSSKSKSDVKSDVKKDDGLGELHVVPFGCRKRASSEDGWMRLCGACQAIRRLPENFFPKFINEVVCDEDKSCIYFKNNPHGKCKQKHMSFTVLKNSGTKACQLWTKFSLNVRVACECFVDERSFFSTYV